MSEPSSEFDPVDDLVEAFLERYRRGERPSLTEYTDKHPELAERIRAVFPALLVMEELGSGDGQATGPHVGPDRLGQPRCPSAWVTTSCSAASDPAAWGSSTRRSRNRWAGTSL